MTSTGEPGDGRAWPDELVTFGDVRVILGVGRQRAHTITVDFRFPRPWFTSRDGTVRLWRWDDVETWLDGHRPGWRDTPPASH